MNRRMVTSALVIVGLAAAMHLDWHVARPAVHHLSLGWRWHWLLAIPVFAVAALYVARAWPDRVLRASLIVIVAAGILAAVVEPAWEYWVDGATFEWAFGRLRLATFASFVAIGVLTQAAVVALTTRRVT